MSVFTGIWAMLQDKNLDTPDAGDAGLFSGGIDSIRVSQIEHSQAFPRQENT
jgi:hypothetical protein